MPKFVTKPRRIVVDAQVGERDSSVTVPGGTLVGLPRGSWYVQFPDGSRRILDQAEFLATFEPADIEAETYLRSVVGEQHE